MEKWTELELDEGENLGGKLESLLGYLEGACEW